MESKRGSCLETKVAKTTPRDQCEKMLQHYYAIHKDHGLWSNVVPLLVLLKEMAEALEEIAAYGGTNERDSTVDVLKKWNGEG